MVPVPGPDPAALEAAPARELLLLVHHHGDADSVGCAIALAAAFPSARISATDGLSAAGKVMAERLEVEIEARPPASWDGTVVVVDTSTPEHCAPLPECDSVVVIDHHQTAGEWPAGTLLIHEPEAKSTAEIVTRLIPELGIELTPQMALPLLAGVYADTGHFRHASSDSFAAAHTLAAAGGEPRQAMILLDRVRPQQQRTMFLKAAQRLKFSQEGKWLLATTRTGSFESGTARLMVALGADVDAARWFVEQQHSRLEREPFAEHDFPLVTAGERDRGLVEGGGFDRELLHGPVGDFFLGLKIEQPVLLIAAEAGETGVFAHGHL